MLLEVRDLFERASEASTVHTALALSSATSNTIVATLLKSLHTVNSTQYCFGRLWDVAMT